jgi:putative transposase
MRSTPHPHYAHHRFPAEVISHVVWLYFRFPLSLRMVEEVPAARGILVSHETVRQWALKWCCHVNSGLTRDRVDGPA